MDKFAQRPQINRALVTRLCDTVNKECDVSHPCGDRNPHSNSLSVPNGDNAKHNQEGRSGESQIAENKLGNDHCLRESDGSGDGCGKVDVGQGTRLAVELRHSIETDEA